jgi:hypothetical protein
MPQGVLLAVLCRTSGRHILSAEVELPHYGYEENVKYRDQQVNVLTSTLQGGRLLTTSVFEKRGADEVSAKAQSLLLVGKKEKRKPEQ